MTDGEICRSFLSAAHRRKQIKVLAELTLRQPEEIKAVLEANGIDLLTPAPKQKKHDSKAAGHMAVLPANVRKEVAYEYHRDYKRRPKRF